MIIEKEFVEIVRRELATRQWSDNRLAREMGADSGYVSRYLSGKISPGPDVIERFFRALDLVPHLSAEKISA